MFVLVFHLLKEKLKSLRRKVSVSNPKYEVGDKVYCWGDRSSAVYWLMEGVVTKIIIDREGILYKVGDHFYFEHQLFSDPSPLYDKRIEDVKAEVIKQQQYILELEKERDESKRSQGSH